MRVKLQEMYERNALEINVVSSQGEARDCKGSSNQELTVTAIPELSSIYNNFY